MSRALTRRAARFTPSRILAACVAANLVYALAAVAPAGTAATSPTGDASRPSRAPVAPIEVTLYQSDGTAFRAIPWGDETASGYETLDGFSIVRGTRGDWVFARLSAGRLTATDRRADNAAPLSGTVRHLRPTAKESPFRRPSGSPPGGTFTGTQASLIILVQFPNRASVGTTPANWNAKFFGASGSVADYYATASYGAFSVGPATESHGTANDGVVGWLTLGYNHPDTRADTSTTNQTLSKDAIVAANPYVNFAAYDADEDGKIESRELHVTVIVAGYETAYANSAASCTPGVWGHQWTIQSPPTVDGVIVGGASADDLAGYTQFGEWHCQTSAPPGHAATIGLMVHEIGHDIGWPDLYDTWPEGAGDSYGVGRWSVMGNGSWNATGGNFVGSSPALPDAFSRVYQGWVAPTVVSGTVAATIDAAATTPEVFQLLSNPGGVDWSFGGESGTGEYFLVENRQLTDYDAGLPGCGLLVWHIDESVRSDNYANSDETHKLVDLEEADGLDQLDSLASAGDPGDPFPGTSSKVTFSAGSVPNSNLYSGAASGVSITDIAGCGASMSATLAASPATICPPDDAAEDNDSLATATPILRGALTAGIACDNDYYALRAFSGQTLTVDLTFVNAQGDLDMRLYNPAGTQVGISDGTTNAERIVHAVTQDGTYYVRVYGFQGASNSYSVVAGAPVCPPDDGAENNDTRATAAGIADGTAFYGIACDDDYLSIAGIAGQLLAINLSFVHAQGDLDMRLYDPAGALVGTSQGTTGTEHLEHMLAQDGTYYVRVYGYQGATNSYALLATLADVTPPAVSGPSYGFGAGTRLKTSTVPVRIAWQGSDEQGGSGLRKFALQRKVNGGSWTNVSLERLRQTSVLLQLAPGKDYQFRVRARDRAGNWSAWVTSRTFRLGATQENNSAVSYDGSWRRSALSGAYGGYVQRASAAGAEATFTFTGRKVAWVSTLAPTRGIAEVRVNGVKVATIDLYRASLRTRTVVWARSWSSSSTREVNIRVLGTAGRPRVDVDAFLTAG